MSRRIMIVDRSGSMRRILKTMILANINDADVFEAADTATSIEKLAAQEYHIVLFSWESASDDWFDFIKKLRERPEKPNTQFVLFTSSGKQEYVERAQAAGVQEHLGIPCTPETLTNTINRVCNPIMLRYNRRYSIIDSTARLEQRGSAFSAEVINISKGGMLCEMEYNEAFNWAAPVMATVLFPSTSDSDRLDASGLYSTVGRLFVQESHPDFTPRLIRVALRFINVPAEAQQVLEQVFSQAESQEKMFAP